MEEDFPQAQRITLVLDQPARTRHRGNSLVQDLCARVQARALLGKLEFVYTPMATAVG